MLPFLLLVASGAREHFNLFFLINYLKIGVGGVRDQGVGDGAAGEPGSMAAQAWRKAVCGLGEADVTWAEGEQEGS